jgi:hypothetical protein
MQHCHLPQPHLLLCWRLRGRIPHPANVLAAASLLLLLLLTLHLLLLLLLSAALVLAACTLAGVPAGASRRGRAARSHAKKVLQQ